MTTPGIPVLDQAGPVPPKDKPSSPPQWRAHNDRPMLMVQSDIYWSSHFPVMMEAASLWLNPDGPPDLLGTSKLFGNHAKFLADTLGRNVSTNEVCNSLIDHALNTMSPGVPADATNKES